MRANTHTHTHIHTHTHTYIYTHIYSIPTKTEFIPMYRNRFDPRVSYCQFKFGFLHYVPIFFIKLILRECRILKNINIIHWNLFLDTPCRWGLEYADCIPCRGLRPPQKGYPGHDTKLHLMVKPQFWKSRECGIPLRCHYSHVHSDMECQ